MNYSAWSRIALTALVVGVPSMIAFANTEQRQFPMAYVVTGTVTIACILLEAVSLLGMVWTWQS